MISSVHNFPRTASQISINHIQKSAVGYFCVTACSAQGTTQTLNLRNLMVHITHRLHRLALPAVFLLILLL